MPATEHAKVERNFVGDAKMLEELRESDFPSSGLRSQAHHDYNEGHLADGAAHTHLAHPHTKSSAEAWEVDVAALRSPSKNLAVKERLENWEPGTSPSLEERTAAADSRRASMTENKIAETAKHNTRAAGVAEKQSKLLAETTNTASAASVERLNQAASKREQLLSQSAQKAGAEFGRAMEIAAAAKAEENMNLAEKREALEADMQAANRRAEAAVEQARGKASTEVQRAEQLSSAKKAELAEKRAQLLAKTAAAESRRVSLEEQKMDKMQQQVEHGKQVRRNKYSTTSPEKDVALPKKPVAMSFDDLVKSPVKEGAAKSPVQARLEAQAMMAEADPENLTSKLAGAAIRKEKMMGAKAATLAKNNLRVETTSDAVKHKQEEMLAAKAEQTETRLAEANDRREALLHASAEKAAASFNHAKEVSSAQKIAALVKIDGRTEELQTQIAAATARRHELQAERVTARKEQIAQLRESFNQRAAQRAAELEAKKAELAGRVEAVEARRVAGLEEIRKKAEAFGVAWSPQRQAQADSVARVLSPGKGPTNLAKDLEVAAQAAAADLKMEPGSPAYVEWIASNKSLKHKRAGVEQVERSPRKDIAAFISATPVTPPPAEAEAEAAAAEAAGVGAEVEEAPAGEAAPAGGGNTAQVVAAAVVAAIAAGAGIYAMSA